MNKQQYTYYISATLLVLAGVAVLPLIADLDIQTPPGTPHEWDRVIKTPDPPTGYPTTESSTEKSEDEKENPRKTRTGKKKDPEPPEYTIGSLMSFYRFTTPDAPNHIKTTIPEPADVDPPEITKQEEGSGVDKKDDDGKYPLEWNYVPKAPAELVMAGMAGSIRHNLHPEHNSAPEINGHLLELGYPASIGANGTAGYGSGAVSGTVGGISSPSSSTPEIPDADNAFRRMVHRITITDLVNGYPFASDPTYGTKIFALSDTAKPSLIACAKSNHTFVKRNAVALLMNYQGEEVTKVLRKRMNDSDRVTSVRALKGLIRRYDKEIVDDLINMLSGGQAYKQSIAAFGLGYIGAKKGVDPLIDEAKSRTNDPQFLWSAIPALARISGNDKKILKALKNIQSNLPGGDKQAVLQDMVDLAAAAHGSRKKQKELVNNLKSSTGVKSYPPPVRYLAIDAIAKLAIKKPGALQIMANIIQDDNPGNRTRAYAVNALPKTLRHQKSQVKNLLGGMATNNDVPAQVRSACLLKLHYYDNRHGANVAAKIARVYASGGGDMDGAIAFLFEKALEIAGTEEELSEGALKKCVKRAASSKAYAKREVNDPNSPFTKVEPHPGLLERSLIELGHAASPNSSSAISLAERILRSDLERGRGPAALALGLIGGKKSAMILSEGLKSDSPWVRCCSYLAMRQIAPTKDIFIDWIFSPRKKFAKKAGAWKSWIQENM